MRDLDNIINKVRTAVYRRLDEANVTGKKATSGIRTQNISDKYGFGSLENTGRRSVGQQMAEIISDALRYKINAEYLKLYDDGNPIDRLSTMPSNDIDGFLPQIAKNVILFYENCSFRWAVNTYITKKENLAEKAVNLLCEYYINFIIRRHQSGDKSGKVFKQNEPDLKSRMTQALEEWWNDVGYLSMKPAFLMFKTEWYKRLYLKLKKKNPETAAERFKEITGDDRDYGKEISSTSTGHFDPTFYHPLYNGREFLDFDNPGNTSDREFEYYNPNYLTKDLPKGDKSQAIKLPDYRTMAGAERVFYGKKGARFEGDTEDTTKRDKVGKFNTDLATNTRYYKDKHAPFMTDYSQSGEQGLLVKDMVAGLDPISKDDDKESRQVAKGSDDLKKRLFDLKQTKKKNAVVQAADTIAAIKQQKDDEEREKYQDTSFQSRDTWDDADENPYYDNEFL